jgi:hypothetical protein
LNSPVEFHHPLSESENPKHQISTSRQRVENAEVKLRELGNNHI